jgi:[ribosomal protein S5]-alanine N-acetyltransferase
MIETQRLLLFPLTHEQLLQYIVNDATLEAALGLKPSQRSISGDLKEAMETTILPNVADLNKNYLFNSLWTIVLKSEQEMVGDLCFFGEPNDLSELELGYGTYPTHCGQGYMTEAVKAIIDWAFLQKNVKKVLADTEKNNVASYRVLEKNGFVKFEETQTLFRWQCKKTRQKKQ